MMRWLHIIRLMILLVLLLASIPTETWAANYALEIIQPRAGLDTTNRFYKAYPGIEYNVKVAVMGGDYPYSYSLTTAPSGMTINSSTGVITWSNPTTTGSPHSITAQVTDLGASGGGNGTGGSTVSVSWTLTVTTSGFIFVDAVNGHASAANGGSPAGDGSISNPFQTINDWYAGNTGGTANPSSSDQTNAGKFVYYRSGTYTFNTYLQNQGQTNRVLMYNKWKPMVHLAYPGEAPIWDETNDRAPIWYGSINNLYLDGLEIKNANYYGLLIESQNSDVTFRRLYMHDLNSYDSAFNNQSFIMHLNVVGTSLQYGAVLDCTFSTLNHGALLKIYGVTKYLIADSAWSNVTDTFSTGDIEGIAIKGGIQDRVEVRNNTLFDIPNEAIGGNQNPAQNIEIRHNNLYNVSTNAVRINMDGLATNVYIYRNTIQGQAVVDQAGTGDGPFIWTNNVVINDSASSEKIDCNGSACATVVTRTGNLSGVTADAIVNSVGQLTGSYRTTYLGTRGYELLNNGGSGGGLDF